MTREEAKAIRLQIQYDLGSQNTTVRKLRMVQNHSSI